MTREDRASNSTRASDAAAENRSGTNELALELRGVTAGYRRTTVLRDVGLAVPRGAVVALLGPNGAGKTTLLQTAAGFLRPSPGAVLIKGADVTKAAPNRRARRGLCLIPEGRGIFPALTVAENLRMQAPPWSKGDGEAEKALDAFPALKPRMGQLAGSMSGGEQQMLALCRAWIAKPEIVLLDEVSMGLAPRAVDTIFQALRDLASAGVALVVVEQYVNRALEIADSVYLLEKGQVVFSGPPSALDRDTLLARYLGLGAEGSG